MAIYNNNYYGTPLAAVNKLLDEGINVLLEIEVQGAMNIMERGIDAVFIFIAPPSVETLKERLVGRASETDEEIERRVSAAIGELEMQDKYDYIVVNDVLDEAVSTVKNIIEGKN